MTGTSTDNSPTLSHRDLEHIVDLSTELIGIADTNGMFEFLNHAWEAMLGHSRAELLSRPFVEFVHPDDLDATAREYQKVLNGRDTFDFENRYRTASNEYRWIRWKGRLIEANRVYFSARDITDEKSAVAERDAIALALEAHSIVVVSDLQARIISANDEFCRVSGYTRDELLGQIESITNSGAHTEAFFDDLWQSITSGQVWRGDLQYRTKNGAPYWLDTTITPVRDVAGNIDRFVSVGHEITERKLITEAVRRDARLFSEIADVSGVGTWEVDIASQEVFWDAQTCRIHEVAEDYVPDLAGAINFYAPDAQPIIEHAVAHSIETGEPWDLELPFITATGKEIWVRAIGRCIREDDKPVKLVGAFQEITLRKEHEEVLEKMRDRALDANTAKTEFLATVSHEVRTPLHGILGMAQLLRRTDLSERQAGFLETLARSGRTLLSLIDDILDISRIETGLLTLQADRCDPVEAIHDVCTGLELLAADKALTFNYVFDWPKAQTVQLDTRRFKQIVANLFGNAIKFTRNGDVTVTLAQLDAHHLRLSVKDSGIGIKAEDQGRIFDRFSQADSSIQREFGGSGLGLSVVHDITELMGGTIKVHSTVGEGSRFEVILPIVLLEASDRPDDVDCKSSTLASDGGTSPDNIGLGKRALVVDDVQTNRLVCSSLLKSVGFEVIDCESGQEALSLLDNNAIDIAYIDLHMPKMSGDECIRHIRTGQTDYASIPIILLTADASMQANDLGRAAGANEVYRKPFLLDQLLEVTQSLLSGTAQGELSRMVLIDDDPVEFNLLEARFEDADIELFHFLSVEAFLQSDLVLGPHDTILLDGRIPPVSSHDVSLEKFVESGCRAQIVLLSNDRYLEYGSYPTLNIVGVKDKMDLVVSELATPL
jgi:PAS domain S-box-containing protein